MFNNFQIYEDKYSVWKKWLYLGYFAKMWIFYVYILYIVNYGILFQSSQTHLGQIIEMSTDIPIFFWTFVTLQYNLYTRMPLFTVTLNNRFTLLSSDPVAKKSQDVMSRYLTDSAKERNKWEGDSLRMSSIAIVARVKHCAIAVEYTTIRKHMKIET